MRMAIVISILAAFMLLLTVPTAIIAAEPPRPSVYGGTATLDGTPAPDGTPVSAVIDGTEVAATTVVNGAYAFTIPQPPGESYSGKTVTFLVGGATAPESGTWEADGGGVLNLSASGGQTVITGQTAQDPVVLQPAPQGTDDGSASKGPKRKAFVGVVDVITEESVTLIQKGKKGSITIALDNPSIKTPGGPVADTFTKDARVVIQARNDGTKLDPAWVAIRVLVKPVKPTVTPLSGTVVGISDGVITIMQPNGSTMKVEVEAGAARPEIGELVTGFADSSPTEGAIGANKPARAKGLVKASKIRERLEGFLQNLTTDDFGIPEAPEGKKVRSARGKAEAAREKAEAARAQADLARANAQAAQGAESADLGQQAAESEEQAAEAEAELAEAEGEVAEAQAEEALEVAEAETDAAERLAEQVSDVASILDAHTAQHTDILQSLVDGGTLPAEALQGIATALENAHRGRSQAALKSAEARSKAAVKRVKDLAKAEEKKVKALVRAEQKRVKAVVRAEQKRAEALTKAGEKGLSVEEIEKARAKAKENRREEAREEERERVREGERERVREEERERVREGERERVLEGERERAREGERERVLEGERERAREEERERVLEEERERARERERERVLEEAKEREKERIKRGF